MPAGLPAPADLAVPKHEVRVRLRTVLGSFEGVAFVGDNSAHTTGPERVGEVLDGPEPFLPLREAGSDRILVYAKKGIRTLIVLDPDRARHEVSELVLGQPEALEITLADGSSVRGTVYLDPRPEKSRVSTLLNQPDPFLALVSDEGVTYVGKEHILRVE
jgi:hypothetical protein